MTTATGDGSTAAANLPPQEKIIGRPATPSTRTPTADASHFAASWFVLS
jgi:hypothetical protein